MQGAGKISDKVGWFFPTFFFQNQNLAKLKITIFFKIVFSKIENFFLSMRNFDPDRNKLKAIKSQLVKIG